MKVYNATSFTFTPAGGGSLVIDDVQDIEINQAADMRVLGSDGDLYQTLAYAENLRVEGTINGTNLSIVNGANGARPGLRGSAVITFKQKAMGAGDAGTGTALVATIGATGGTMVLGPVRTSASHAGGPSRIALPFTAVSPDGINSSVAWSLA